MCRRSYAIRRHAEGGGRKDILTLGEPDGVAPYLQVEIYRPGSEIRRFADPQAEIAPARPRSGRSRCKRDEEPLASKFGPLSIVSFAHLERRRRAIASASCATTTIRGCNCPAGSARAAADSSAQHTGLCARSADAAVRRQRAEDRRAVRASRTQSQLLRPARSDPGGDAEIPSAVEGAGEPAGAAAHWALNDHAAACRRDRSSQRFS